MVLDTLQSIISESIMIMSDFRIMVENCSVKTVDSDNTIPIGGLDISCHIKGYPDVSYQITNDDEKLEAIPSEIARYIIDEISKLGIKDDYTGLSMFFDSDYGDMEQMYMVSQFIMEAVGLTRAIEFHISDKDFVYDGKDDNAILSNGYTITGKPIGAKMMIIVYINHDYVSKHFADVLDDLRSREGEIRASVVSMSV